MSTLNHLLPLDWNIKLSSKLYNEDVKRENPTAIVFLIDQSSSMKRNTVFKGKSFTYAEVVADMINTSLNELIGRCTKSEGVRDYFEICVIGYGGQTSKSAEILWENALVGNVWVTISGLKFNTNMKDSEVEKNIRGKITKSIQKVPYWFEAKSNYMTPMGAAFDKAYDCLLDWITNEHKNAYPPVVINITDGEQTDCSDSELLQKADKIKSLHTTDGHVLLMNCHIGNDVVKSVQFPITKNELPDNTNCELLFDMSSDMPLVYSQKILGFTTHNESDTTPKGFAYNANMDILFNLIDIGTSGATTHITQ
jgi:uncharacterized protein YegL